MTLIDLNRDYGSLIGAGATLILGLFGWSFYNFYKEIQSKKGDASEIVKNSFFSLGKKYKILAVHQYQTSDDISGYVQLGQNSRPDQWQKLIKIKSFWGIYHTIYPLKKEDILNVIISRNGKEKWKVIGFNR